MNPLTTAGLVIREVRTGERDGAPTRIAAARRTYPTDRADLWSAVTDAERIPRWFLPVTGDLRVGGRYQLEGNAGGVVERCDEPESFAVTWEYGGDVSWLTVTLSQAGDGTTLELVHEAHVDPAFAEQFGPGAVGLGWDLGLLGLGMYVESGRPVDPEVAATFNVSAEGREFIRAASDDWAEAAIADGDDPDLARRAADAAYDAYTAAPEG